MTTKNERQTEPATKHCGDLKCISCNEEARGEAAEPVECTTARRSSNAKGGRKGGRIGKRRDERRLRAHALRKEGLSVATIASELGCSTVTALELLQEPVPPVAKPDAACPTCGRQYVSWVGCPECAPRSSEARPGGGVRATMPGHKPTAKADIETFVFNNCLGDPRCGEPGNDDPAERCPVCRLADLVTK